MDKPIDKYCCDDWAKAHQSGTDNEMYGALVHYPQPHTPHIGCDLPRVKFCPWCGASKD